MSHNPFLAMGLFLGAIGCFVGAIVLMMRLGRERLEPPSTRRQFWTGWMPGEFTPAGVRLRKRITTLFIAGWALSIAGLLA